MSNVDIKDVFSAFRKLLLDDENMRVLKTFEYDETTHSVILHCICNESRYYVYENGSYILSNVYPTFDEDFDGFII